MADVEEKVEVVVAHNERATLRVGDVFLKIDVDPTRTQVEIEAMTIAPIPTPEVLWWKPPVLASPPCRGRLWAISASSRWRRQRHGPRLAPPSGRSTTRPCRHGLARIWLSLPARLDSECEWLITNDVLPVDVVTRNHRIAEAALRPWAPVFTHGDLQADHVFVDDDEITGVIDWSDAGQGDALFDLAILTLGHQEQLGDVVAGYGTDVDLDVIRAWWSLRCLVAGRWLIEHGFDPSLPGCEFAVLRSQL